MTKQRIFSILGLVSLATWVIYSYIETNFPFNPEQVVNLITKQTAKKLDKEYELHLVATGGGMLNNDIKVLFMGFDYFHPIDQNSGRKLLVASIKEYLDAINTNEKIRPYLNVYPFTAKNIRIKIFIRRPDKGTVSSNQISYLSADDGIITYHRKEPNKYPSIIVHKETYEEAVQKMK